MTASAGIIKSRDFVNLRCWRLCRNGQIQSYATDNDDDDVGPPSFAMPSLASTYSEPLPMMTISDGASNTTRATVHRDADDRLSDVGTPSLSVPRSAHRRIEHDVRQSAAAVATPPPPGSANLTEDADAAVRTGLNRSLGASGFFDATDMHSGDEDDFADAEGNASGLASPSQSGSLMGAGADGNGAVGAAADCSSSNVYISAAISLAYDKLPAIPKYTRAENRLSCWAMREIDGKPNACIFEWLMCIDLKGYIPTTLLNQVRWWTIVGGLLCVLTGVRWWFFFAGVSEHYPGLYGVVAQALRGHQRGASSAAAKPIRQPKNQPELIRVFVIVI